MSVNSATVRLRVRSGEYVLCDKDGARNSEVWTLFKSVCIRITKEFVGFVQCSRCETLFRFKKSTGTSNLKRHADKCNGSISRSNSSTPSPGDASESDILTVEEHAQESDGHFRQPGPSNPAERSKTPNTIVHRNTPEGSSFSESSSSSTGTDTDTPHNHSPATPGTRERTRTKAPKLVPQDVKNKITDSCVKMCAVDLRPFNTVNGPGFKNVAQSLIEVGAKFGNVNAESVLPHSSTVSRKTSEVAEKVRDKFLPEVKEALRNNSCAFDADLWSDKYTKTAYLTTTAQYVTKDFQLKSLVLFTVDFPADQAKTGENIRKFSTAALEKLRISDADAEKVTYVTDEGKNVINAFERWNHLCTAHNLATVLRHLLNEKFLIAHAPSVMKSLDVGRNVVTYLKRSGLCKLLPHSVKTLLEIRWDSVVDMFISLCDSFPHIVKVLTYKNEQHRLDGWDGELVSDLIELLIEFKNVTKELQAKKVPTIQNVVVRYHDLLKHCTAKDEDSEEIQALKKKATELLKEKLILREEHYIGAILCPNIRSLSQCELQEREHARSLVLSRMKEIPLSDASEAVAPPPAKKSRYGSWEDDATSAQTPEDELELYLKTGKKEDDDPATLLAWWKNHACLFPRLAILAQRILAIPATSANSERNFSRAGIIINDKRSQICPENVDHSLVIHNYYLSLDANSEEEKIFFQEDLGGP